jgi:hypothetical protein
MLECRPASSYFFMPAYKIRTTSKGQELLSIIESNSIHQKFVRS